MDKVDKFTAALLITGSFLLLVGAARQYSNSLQVASWQKTGYPVSIDANLLLLGRKTMLGQPGARYTLVEFADYQCPPCRASQQDVQDSLTEYKQELRFDFRNFPLEAIHHNALEAARIAETARHFGCFWKVHDQLMATELEVPRDHHFFMALLRKDGVNILLAEKFYQESSRATIDGDAGLGAKMGVRGTPSFFLCRPDEQVVRLSSLQQLQYWLRS